MPQPMLITLVHVLVFEEEWAFAAEKRNYAPEEQKGKGVKRPKPANPRQYNDALVAWELAIVEAHFDKKLITCQEC